jgi:hypothetical protein
MRKYDESRVPSEPLELHEATLELPDGRDFTPVINRRAPAGFLEFCASYLPKLRQRPDYRQSRLESRCDVEFDLEHPERVPATYPIAFLDELLPM